MFRARLPSIVSTCHKMPCLPRNLHVDTTSRSPDNAIRKKHATWHVESAAPATRNDDGGRQSAAPTTKTGTHLLETWQKYCACHTKRLSTRDTTRLNVTKCHACHAKRGYATCETSKVTTVAKTRHRHGHTASHGRPRTVANGCERLQMVAQHRANTPSNPQTPRVKREPLLRIREKTPATNPFS